MVDTGIIKKNGKFLDAFLPSFKRHLEYIRFYKCLPFEWNEKQEKILVLSNRVCIRLWTFVSVAYILFQVVNINHKSQALSDTLVAGLILGIYLGGLILRLEFETDSTPIEILNRLIHEQGNESLLMVP